MQDFLGIGLLEPLERIHREHKCSANQQMMMVDIFFTWHVFGRFWWLMTCFQWRWVHGCEPREEASTCEAGHGLNCDPCPGKRWHCQKHIFSTFQLPFLCFQPACPCQCQAPWTGSGNISTATCTLSSLECKSGVHAQFVISTTYCLNICHVTNMKPKSRVTVCHACFFFFFSFVQTRLESTCTFFFGQGKSLRTVLIMPCFDWTRLESQVKWSQTRVYLHIAFFFGQGKSARHWTNSLSHSQSWGQKYRQDCQKHRNKKTQEIHWRNFTLKKLWTEFPNIIVV